MSNASDDEIEMFTDEEWTQPKKKTNKRIRKKGNGNTPKKYKKISKKKRNTEYYPW